MYIKLTPSAANPGFCANSSPADRLSGYLPSIKIAKRILQVQKIFTLSQDVDEFPFRPGRLAKRDNSGDTGTADSVRQDCIFIRVDFSHQ